MDEFSAPALSPLVPRAPAPGVYAALGPQLLPSWFLWALEPALKAGRNIFWVDAGNSFDPYGASYAARALGWEPKEILSRVQVARPFNLFQLETMVRVKLPRQWKDEPVIVSDLFPLFYDEDVSVAEAEKVFRAVLSGMRALPAVWLTLVVEREAPKGRERWQRELLKSASAVANLQGPAWRLEKS